MVWSKKNLNPTPTVTTTTVMSSAGTWSHFQVGVGGWGGGLRIYLDDKRVDVVRHLQPVAATDFLDI